MDPRSTAGILVPESVAPIVTPTLPPTPVQAPQRRGPLSTLFGGLSSKLRR